MKSTEPEASKLRIQGKTVLAVTGASSKKSKERFDMMAEELGGTDWAVVARTGKIIGALQGVLF